MMLWQTISTMSNTYLCTLTLLFYWFHNFNFGILWNNKMSMSDISIAYKPTNNSEKRFQSYITLDARRWSTRNAPISLLGALGGGENRLWLLSRTGSVLFLLSLLSDIRYVRNNAAILILKHNIFKKHVQMFVNCV